MKSIKYLWLLCAFTSGATPPLPATVDQIVRAIWLAEGGDKTRYPYGIKSVKVRDAKHARTVCVRTVKRAIDDWIHVGHHRQPCFIKYLGLRYCPKESDPVGHGNWVRNVRKFLKPTALSKEWNS